MHASENLKIIRNSPLMILARTVSSILPLLFIVYSYLGPDEESEGTSILAQYPIHCVVAIIIILLLCALFFFLDWKTKTLYQYSDCLSYEKGIINKQKVTVRYENISTVDIYRPLIYRFFRLAKLKIDSNTISQQNVEGSEIVLILTDTFAEQKKTELLNSVSEYEIQTSGKSSSHPSQSEQTPLIILSRGKVMLMMFLSALMGMIIFIPILISGVFSVIVPLLDFPYSDIILLSLLGLASIIFIMLAITFISSLLLYHKFTLSHSPQRLHLSYGLMDIKNITIPFRKINGLKLSQNILQRKLKLYSVSVLSAGYGDEKNELQSVIAPSATEQEVLMIIKQVYNDIPDFSKKIRPEGAAKFLYFLPSVVLLLISFIAVLLNAPVLSVAAIGGILLIFSSIAGFLQYKNTGLFCENGYCRLDKGGIFRSVVILPINRCQTATMKSGPIQQLYKKGNVKFWLFSSAKGFSDSIRLRHMNIDVIYEVFHD